MMLLDEAVKCLRAIEMDSPYEDRDFSERASLASNFSEIHAPLRSYIRSSISRTVAKR